MNVSIGAELERETLSAIPDGLNRKRSLPLRGKVRDRRFEPCRAAELTTIVLRIRLDLEHLGWLK